MKDNAGERVFDIDKDLEERILERENNNRRMTKEGYQEESKGKESLLPRDNKGKAPIIKLIVLILVVYSGLLTAAAVFRLFKKK